MGLSIENYTIDDTAMEEYEVTTKENSSSWFKPEADTTYNIRILPVGNTIQNLPFLERAIHDCSYTEVGDDGQPRKKYVMVNCWNHIAQNIKTLGKALADKQLLTKTDLELYKKHQCPICNIRKYFLDTHGDKKTANKFYAQTKFLWNILVRPEKSKKDDPSQAYVWACSRKIFETIRSTYIESKEEGVDIFHPKTGYDWILNSTGSGFQRRYEIRVKAATKGVPLGEYEGEIADLVEVFTKSFHNYQETINIVKTAYNALLEENEYVIPGDKTAQADDGSTPF